MRVLRRGEEFDVPLDLPEHLAEHFALKGMMEFLEEDPGPQRELTAAELADQEALEAIEPVKPAKGRRKK